MNVDWARLRAVVIESDDWGLCAWTPDEAAFEALAATPAWKTPAGRIYGRSTLEGPASIERLAELLLEFRGGDEFAPVLQANTIVATPDYEHLRPPGFEAVRQPLEVPLVFHPRTPSRWERPGLWAAVHAAGESGVWWPELHGLHHLPVTAWLAALRRGDADARAAFEHQSPIGQAVQRSSEYDASEPRLERSRRLGVAIERFHTLFGRAPGSLCPPDYRWDDALERDAERLGLTTLQGKAEQHGLRSRLPGALRRGRAFRFRGRRFYTPARVAFEPRGAGDAGASLGAARAHEGARAAWRRGEPAVLSTHRVNYVHLDDPWCESGRAALRDLLARLTGDGAIFLTDTEVRAIVERGWSARPVGTRAAIVRCYGAGAMSVRFAAPRGTLGATIRQGRGAGGSLTIDEGDAVGTLNHGEYLVEWEAA